VEDDPALGGRLRVRLRQDNYAVDWVQDGRSAESAIDASPYALVLLDLKLPRKDGYAVLAYLRQHIGRVPILIIAAHNALAQCVIGIDRGADNCLVWPDDLQELDADVRAVLGRYGGTASLTAMSRPHAN
jgi:two-component system response regulator QseB